MLGRLFRLFSGEAGKNVPPSSGALSPLDNAMLNDEDICRLNRIISQSTKSSELFSGALEHAPNYDEPHLRSLKNVAFPLGRMPLNGKMMDLVLDLDETLAHSSTDGVGGWDFISEVFLGGVQVLYYVSKRPHLDYFIDVVSNWFNIVIFTSSIQAYSDPVISWIDRGRGVIKGRFFRQHCIKEDNVYIKDLDLVSEDFSRLILIDNCHDTFGSFPDSVIPISSWFSEKSDTALVDILPFLDAIRFTTDVRSVLALRRCFARD